MLLRVARQTIVAAILIALLAVGWQVVTGPGGTGTGGTAALERMHHDDD